MSVLFGCSEFEMMLSLQVDVTWAVDYESASPGRGLGWRCEFHRREQLGVVKPHREWV